MARYTSDEYSGWQFQGIHGRLSTGMPEVISQGIL